MLFLLNVLGLLQTVLRDRQIVYVQNLYVPCVEGVPIATPLGLLSRDSDQNNDNFGATSTSNNTICEQRKSAQKRTGRIMARPCRT